MPRAEASGEQIANISGYVFENQGLFLTSEAIPSLLTIPTPTLAVRAEKLLSFIAKETGPGVSIVPGLSEIESQLSLLSSMVDDPFQSDLSSEKVTARTFPFIAASWSRNGTEVEYLVFRYLFGMGYLEKGSANMSVMVAPKGWQVLQTKPASQGSVCFVAMWFDPGLTSVWTGPIAEGIRKAGYEPFRVDQKEHNDDVSDEIIAAIRTAKFVLADFTGHRGGVYYEAGFAHGLGKTVIRTVRRNELGSLHFDTRQLNHIAWDEDKPEEFAKAITNRIVATVGRGPIG